MTNTDPHPSLSTALADLPAKVRVHDLAKRVGTGSKEIIAALAAAGVTAGSASSSVDRDTATALLTTLLGGPEVDAADVAEAPAELPEAAGAADPAADTEAGGDGEVPDGEAADGPRSRRRRGRGGRGRNRGSGDRSQQASPAEAEAGGAAEPEPGATTGAEPTAGSAQAADEADTTSQGQAEAESAIEDDAGAAGSRRRRRGRRGRGRAAEGGDQTDAVAQPGGSQPDAAAQADSAPDADAASTSGEPGDAGDAGDGESASSRRRRRRRRGSGNADSAVRDDDPDDTVVHVREPRQASAEVLGVKGSTRLEAKRQRRKDTRDTRRRPQILSEAEFLARRESVERVMAIRQRGELSQVALLEDGVLVEHFVSRAGSESMIGNVYLGRVQNVLPSMEAAFVDIGRGRNAVLYAGEVNWDMAGLVGKARRIETALSSGDTVLVQVSKDPIGHKGSRLTSQISLPGRFLVYVPGGGATGISRKLPDTERRRLKSILDRIVPEGAGVIIRTAAEGVDEAELIRDVERLRDQWEQIETAAAKKSSAPVQLYGEPGTLIKVIRDLFNSDITSLVVDGDQAWAEVSDYVLSVAPELAPRVGRYAGDGDVFAHYRVDEQIAKALERKVHLPSGGSLVIDRTEAMTVVDVNTGKFTGSGGNLEETVTRNNLEAAEEIVRQLRLRDIGGIIVVDFIDMVLESNRELVLRRLTECLGRDRTRHQVAEVTSLGLVQMTRKRMGIGLVEAFSEPCPHCGGRGIVLHDVPIAATSGGGADGEAGERRNRRRGRPAHEEPVKIEPLVVERVVPDAKPDPRGPRAPAAFRAETATPGEIVVVAQDVSEATPEDVIEQAAEPAVTEPATAGQATEPTASDQAVEPTSPAIAESVDPSDTPVPAKPARRRRAAGRPAGAPVAVTEVLDLVIPVASIPEEIPSVPSPAVEVPFAEPTPAESAQAEPQQNEPEQAEPAPARRRSSRAGGTRSGARTDGSTNGGSSRGRKPKSAQTPAGPEAVAIPAD